MSYEIVYAQEAYDIAINEDGFEVLEIGAQGLRGVKGEPASLGGSLRSVSGKAEAGGTRQTISNLGTIDLAISNRWKIEPEDNTSELSIANAPADCSFSLWIVGTYAGFGVDPIQLIDNVAGAQNIIWPDNTPPAAWPQNAGEYLPLAFERDGSTENWLGYYGKIHRSS